MPHLRYLNAHGRRNGQPLADERGDPRLQQNRRQSGETVSHFHLGPGKLGGYIDLPAQTLAYNEIATKMNWHYLRVNVDLAERRFLGFQCNDLIYEGDPLQYISIPAMPNLNCMLNTAFLGGDQSRQTRLPLPGFRTAVSGEF